jgi:hypothetical protein
LLASEGTQAGGHVMFDSDVDNSGIDRNTHSQGD